MKPKFTLIVLLLTVCAYAQTTVQFSEPHQFLSDSDTFFTIKIVVNGMGEYISEEPIIVQLISDLEDVSILGITTTRAMDKVIFPGQYNGGEEIRIPFNPEALKSTENFNLYLRKKDGDESFEIFQGIHTVIVNKSIKDASYVRISEIPIIGQKTNFIHNGKIEIPFKTEIEGNYSPVEADEAVAKVKIKGIEQSDTLNIFKLAGVISTHKFRIEKSKNPELYKELKKTLATGEKLELEIFDIVHKSEHQIRIAPEKSTIRIGIKKGVRNANTLSRTKSSRHDIGQKKTNSLRARYDFYAGGSFDFNNNFKFEEAYYEMIVSLYNLFKNQWGLRAGIYKNNNSRSLEEKFRYKWVSDDLEQHNLEDIIYTSRVLNVVANVSTESLGFYLEFPYKIIESGNFSAFIAPHAELIKRIEKYTYEVVSEDTEETVTVPVDNPVTSLKYPALWLEKTTQYWDSYLGLSFPMLYQSPESGFEVFISPIVGAGYPQQAADSTLFDPVESSGASIFGAFQFYLTISAKETLGFKLGADVRKYVFTGQKPTVSVNISTKLDLSNIIGLTGGK